MILCIGGQGSENGPQRPRCLLPSPTLRLGRGPQPPGCCPLQVAEIRVEMELRDEILPRAYNIRSRLDRQTIETEEVWVTRPALPLPSDLDSLSLTCPHFFPR